MTDFAYPKIVDAHVAVTNVITVRVSITQPTLGIWHVVVSISVVVRDSTGTAVPLGIVAHHVHVLLQLVQGVLEGHEEIAAGVAVAQEVWFVEISHAWTHRLVQIVMLTLLRKRRRRRRH